MNRRIEVKLTKWQRRRLQKIRDNPPTPRIGKRAVCLLLSAYGACSKLISQVTGLSGDAITDIRRRWHQRGMTSLRELSRPGRPPKITVQYRKQLRKALRAGLLSYGYIFSTWSIARLNAHFYRFSLPISRMRTMSLVSYVSDDCLEKPMNIGQNAFSGARKLYKDVRIITA